MRYDEYVYAGFWIRTWATIIDNILLMVITIPIIVVIYGWSHYTDGYSSLIGKPIEALISWGLPMVAIVSFWILKQATPGKMAISARIVDATTGEAASSVQLIIRYFSYFISMLPLGLGLFWIAFDKRKQGWHDKIANTVVVIPIHSQSYRLLRK